MQQDTNELILLTNLLTVSEPKNQGNDGLSQKVFKRLQPTSTYAAIVPALIHAVMRVESNFNVKAL
jgi:soluble lytic murein transglycosylase-like protein